MAINRRTLLKGAGALIGLGTVSGGVAWWWNSPEFADLSNWTGFSADDVALLNEIAESIIPATNTPGAKAADVGAFMAIAVTECFDPPEQAAFVAGLRRIESLSVDRYGRSFRSISAAERSTVLAGIERERRRRELWNRGERGLRILARRIYLGPPLVQVAHYFTMMQDLTVRGYFTSRLGATETLRHRPVPGDYNGALPYRKGDRAWSL
jgi:hypothetical protein